MVVWKSRRSYAIIALHPKAEDAEQGDALAWKGTEEHYQCPSPSGLYFPSWYPLRSTKKIYSFSASSGSSGKLNFGVILTSIAVVPSEVRLAGYQGASSTSAMMDRVKFCSGKSSEKYCASIELTDGLFCA